MASKELIEYVKQSLTTGIGGEEIKSALMNVGWLERDIEEAFRSIGQAPAIFNSQVEIKRQKSGLIIKISILAVIFIISISAAVYYYYFIQRPKSVLRQMPSRMMSAETIKYSLNSISKTTTISGDSRDYYNKVAEKFKQYNTEAIKIQSVKKEVLDGKEVYHYNIALNPDGVGWLIQSINEVDLQKNYEELSRQQKESLSDRIEIVIKNGISQIRNIDLYVGANDFYVYKLKIDTAFFGGDRGGKSFEIDVLEINGLIKPEEAEDLKFLAEFLKASLNISIK